jgi:hypothetical protein
MELIGFDEALEHAAESGPKPHLLLGNGFSIACRPDCFTYGALLDEANFAPASTDVKAIFDVLGTVDFEKVIEALRFAAAIVDHYGGGHDLHQRLGSDANVVKEALARVLGAKHPDNVFEISTDEYAACRAFLAPFNKIYTTNYDMLLYWTLMQEMDPYVERNDGFGNPDDEFAPYVVWQPYEVTGTQRVHFLHGGLHLYDRGDELVKVTYSRTQVPIVDQIRAALDEGRFPLVVTEGTSAEKRGAILHHAYLTHAIRSLSSIQGSLFVYGLSLTPNDEHILRRIEKGKLSNLYISIYGDSESTTNKMIEGRAEALAATRTARQPLHVHFFDAESAHVWR